MRFNRAHTNDLQGQVHQACDELRRRLRAGEVCRAEEFFASEPALSADPECAIQLIHAEWSGRLERGEQPILAEWLQRFPQWRDRLERCFLEDSLLGASLLENTPTVQLGSESNNGLSATLPAAHTGGDATPGEALLPPLEIHHEIGRGAMGVVYLAWDKVLDRSVALKKMRPGLLDRPESVRRFYHEARAAARLHHPNIIAIHGMGRIGDQHAFTMPLAKTNLDQERGRFANAGAAATLLAKVARAAHAAHRDGLVHRDLKPANILLDDRDEPLVADFGLAVLLSDVKPADSGEIAGTPHYMAPEQFGAFGGRVSEAIDIWALGVILYELLSGQRPFQAKSMGQLQAVIRKADPSPLVMQPKGVERGLEAIVRRCLEKNPSERYATAEALAQDLENWREGKPIQAKPEGYLRRTWRRIRRYPALSTAAVLLLAFAALLGGLIAAAPALMPRPAPPPEDPDTLAIRSINARLKNGEMVEFVTPEGRLLRHRWIHESGGVEPNERKEGVDVSTLRVPALLELVPEVPLERYEFSAEVMQWTTMIGQPGIYALHHVDSEAPVPAHSFLTQSFGEQKPWAGFVFVSLQYQDKTNYDKSIAQGKFKPNPDQWHKLTVRVTPEEISLLYNGDLLRKLPTTTLDKHAGDIRRERELVGGEPAHPQFRSGGGVGLYLVIGQATYRSITLKPLP